MSRTDIGLLQTLQSQITREKYESNKRAETAKPSYRDSIVKGVNRRVEDQQCHLPGPTFSPAPRFRATRPNTSRLLQQDLARCYVESRIPAENRARARRRIRRPSCTPPRGRSFSSCRCVCFWFGSGHLRCDTAAILTPRPSSITNEFKAKRSTLFFWRLKSSAAVP